MQKKTASIHIEIAKVRRTILSGNRVKVKSLEKIEVGDFIVCNLKDNLNLKFE